MEGSFWALADDLFVKIVLSGLAAVGGVAGGWFMSRASIMGAVNKRVETLLGHLELEVARSSAAHHACEAKLQTVSGRLDQVEGELRQTKQTLDSISRVKP